MKNGWRIFILFVATAVLAGCATTNTAPPNTQAHGVWQKHQQRQATLANRASAFNASASINYVSPHRKGRLTMRMWGNSELPLRLDLSAGFGTTVAMWREDSTGWTGFFPTDEVAYHNHDVRTGLRMAGLDFPFSLQELSQLISGSYQSIIPKEYEAVEQAPDGRWTFFFAPGQIVNTMTLDAQGKAMLFAGRLQGRKWSLTLDRYTLEGEIETARKLTLALSPGVSAVVRVKKFVPRDTPWPEDGLSLVLPPGTRLLSPNGNGS